MSLAVQSMLVEDASIPDSTGSPMNISTTICFAIEDPVAAKYNVENFGQFIRDQAFDVMRRICGKFKYRSNDPTEVSLLNDSHHVCQIMAKLLEKRVSQAGIKIHRMDFTELSYAPGVASGLL